MQAATQDSAGLGLPEVEQVLVSTTDHHDLLLMIVTRHNIKVALAVHCGYTLASIRSHQIVWLLTVVCHVKAW